MGFVGDRRLQLSMIVSQTDIKSATLALVTGKLAEARSQLIACPPQVMLGAKRRQMPLVKVLARMMTKVSAATCCHLQLLLLQHLGSLATNLLALTFLVTQATLNMTLMIVVETRVVLGRPPAFSSRCQATFIASALRKPRAFLFEAFSVSLAQFWDRFEQQ